MIKTFFLILAVLSTSTCLGGGGIIHSSSYSGRYLVIASGKDVQIIDYKKESVIVDFNTFRIKEYFSWIGDSKFIYGRKNVVTDKVDFYSFDIVSRSTSLINSIPDRNLQILEFADFYCVSSGAKSLDDLIYYILRDGVLFSFSPMDSIPRKVTDLNIQLGEYKFTGIASSGESNTVFISGEKESTCEILRLDVKNRTAEHIKNIGCFNGWRSNLYGTNHNVILYLNNNSPSEEEMIAEIWLFDLKRNLHSLLKSYSEEIPSDIVYSAMKDEFIVSVYAPKDKLSVRVDSGNFFERIIENFITSHYIDLIEYELN